MKLSQDEKVNDFLEGLKIADGTMYEIIVQLRSRLFALYPNVEEKMMYGGIMFAINSEMFSGLFAYKNHVSMEFSNGYLMKDEDKLLEGKGKFRRHLKFKNLEDIERNKVKTYITQAI